MSKTLSTVLSFLVLLGLFIPSGRAAAPANPFDSTLSSYPARIQVAGHIGGTARQVALNNGLAYVANNASLAVYDISDPAHPQLVGEMLYPAVVEIDQIEIAGSLVFLACRGNGLLVLDISDPFHPALVKFWPDYFIESLAVSGSYLYASTYNDLLTVDISHPVSLKVITITQNVNAFQLLVTGGYLLASDSSNGLRVYSLADPANPRLETIFPIQPYNGAQFMRLSGSRLFISASGTIHILELSDPAHPQDLGSWPGTGEWMGLLGVEGNTLYLIDGYNTLHILDASAPTSIQELGHYSSLQQAGMIGGQDGLVFASPGLALYTAYNQGLRLLDTSNPAAVHEIGTAEPPAQLAATVLEGGLAYSLDYENGLKVLDISQPAAPRLLGTSRLDASWPRDIVIYGGYAFISALHYGLEVVWLADPAHPQVVASYQDSVGCGRLQLSGHYLLAAGCAPAQTDSILFLWDISDPLHPQQTGQFQASSPIYDIALQGSTVFLDAYDLVAVDISTPAAPHEIGRLPGQGYTEHLAVLDNIAYLGIESFIQRADVSDPAHMRWLRPITPDPTINYVYVRQLLALPEERLLAITMATEVQLWDVANPLHPRQVGLFARNGWMNSLMRQGSRLYLNDIAGLTILDVSGDIAGRFAAPDGSPAPGVTIRDSAGLTTTSALDGSFSFSGLGLGVYTITPTLPGFVIQPPASKIAVPSFAAQNQAFTVLPQPLSTALQSGVAATLVYTGVQGAASRLAFPPEAVTQTLTAVLTPTLLTGFPPGSGPGGQAFQLGVYDLAGLPQSDFRFTAPLTLTLGYSDADIRLLDESTLHLLRWDGSAWAAPACPLAASPQRDLVRNLLITAVCQAGRYGLFGSTHTIYFPVMLNGEP